MHAEAQSLPPTANGVLETALYTDDLETARKFYGRTLGFEEILYREKNFAFFKCGSTVCLLFDPVQTRMQPLAPPAKQIPGHGTTGAGHVCFSAPGDKLDQWRQHLEASDIAIESEIVWENGAGSIYFRDPAGNSLEFAQPKLWGYDEGKIV